VAGLAIDVCLAICRLKTTFVNDAGYYRSLDLLMEAVCATHCAYIFLTALMSMSGLLKLQMAEFWG
jgi:hypothetical protein